MFDFASKVMVLIFAMPLLANANISIDIKEPIAQLAAAQEAASQIDPEQMKMAVKALNATAQMNGVSTGDANIDRLLAENSDPQLERMLGRINTIAGQLE